MLDRSTNRRAGDAAARQAHSCNDQLATNSQPATLRQPIHAELTGSNICRAAGMAAHGHAPVLAMCRALVQAGFDPDRPLHAYRGPILCLRVRSIGEAAGLEINGRGTGLKRRRGERAASPMREKPRGVA